MRPIILAALAALVSSTAGAQAPPFTAVQPELFVLNNSFANGWADYDNDGDLDLAVAAATGLRLYRNDGGRFVSVGEHLGLPAKSDYELRGLSWGDYDGDGWPDLIIGPTDADRTSLVFHNQGAGRFVEVAAKIGLALPGRSSRVSNWIDYDNDGDLDLYAPDRAGANRLMRNDGGVFVEDPNGPKDPRPTVGACWFDYDQDGDLDVFIANQAGEKDGLWRNDGGVFVDVAAQAGVQSAGRTKEQGGVGCTIGDFDNDGLLDIFVANYGPNALFRNKGDGTFENVAASVGLGADNHAVGASFGDYDNDGLLDLYVTTYERTKDAAWPIDALYRNTGKGGFVNVISEGGLLRAGDHGVQWIDFDLDGALDLSLTRGYPPTGGHPVFHNEVARSVAARSLSVLVQDARGRATRAGAEVRLYDANGRIIASRLVTTGDGYSTQSVLPVHFGLKSRTPVTVEVAFMGPGGRKLQTLHGVDPAAYAGRSLVIREGD